MMPVLVHSPYIPTTAFAVQVLTHAGPLQARLQALGQQHMAELRQAFVDSCSKSEVPFVVRPAARLVVLRRRTAAL